MSVFVCRPSSSAWRFPAAEGRSLLLKGRWKLMILTSAMMNTCTELQQQCSLGWLGRYFQTCNLIYQFNSPDLLILIRDCGGVLLILALFWPSTSLSILSPPRQIVFFTQCYWRVWDSGSRLRNSLPSPQIWSRPPFCCKRCSCKLLLNVKLKQVT